MNMLDKIAHFVEKTSKSSKSRNTSPIEWAVTFAVVTIASIFSGRLATASEGSVEATPTSFKAKYRK